MLFVISLSKAQSEVNTKIQVSVTFGESYANVLGLELSAKAKALAESELVALMQDQIRYFHFVPSNMLAPNRLRFHIDNPPVSNSMTMSNIHDYYLFVSLQRGNTVLAPKLDWLFRGADSNLNGADSEQSIAQLLINLVEVQHHKIVGQLLSQISFTNNAVFKKQGRVKGWVIKHSAKALCLYKRSKVRVTSIVPGGGFEDEFDAEVKKHPNDHLTTFTKTQDDVSSLEEAPEQAKVVAVHVISYERQCEQGPITEVSPTTVTFAQGDGQ